MGFGFWNGLLRSQGPASTAACASAPAPASSAVGGFASASRPASIVATSASASTEPGRASSNGPLSSGCNPGVASGEGGEAGESSGTCPTHASGSAAAPALLIVIPRTMRERKRGDGISAKVYEPPSKCTSRSAFL